MVKNIIGTIIIGLLYSDLIFITLIGFYKLFTDFKPIYFIPILIGLIYMYGFKNISLQIIHGTYKNKGV